MHGFDGRDGIAELHRVKSGLEGIQIDVETLPVTESERNELIVDEGGRAEIALLLDLIRICGRAVPSHRRTIRPYERRVDGGVLQRHMPPDRRASLRTSQ
jgi:hypothetical protein